MCNDWLWKNIRFNVLYKLKIKVYHIRYRTSIFLQLFRCIFIIDFKIIRFWVLKLNKNSLTWTSGWLSTRMTASFPVRDIHNLCHSPREIGHGLLLKYNNIILVNITYLYYTIHKFIMYVLYLYLKSNINETPI